MGLKAQVAGREIKLFVVKRIVGNVHLAILAGDLSFCVDDHSSVVVNARGSLFKERSHNDNLVLFRDFAERLGSWSGNSFRKFEERDVFGLAEILRTKKLLQANNLRAFPCRLANARDCFFKVASGFGSQLI